METCHQRAFRQVIEKKLKSATGYPFEEWTKRTAPRSSAEARDRRGFCGGAEKPRDGTVGQQPFGISDASVRDVI